MTINLTSGTGHEVTNGTNTINWAGNAIEKISGGTANDLIYGNTGNNTLSGRAGNDTLDGGSGNDIYNYYDSSWGSDSLIDGSGTDTIDFEPGLSANLTINLTSGAGNEVADGTNVANWAGSIIENVQSSSGNDVIYGSSVANSVLGGAGHDNIFGNDGNDTLEGGTGNDTMYGGNGNDSISGGNGFNAYYGEAGNDTLVGGSSSDTYGFSGTFGADTIIDIGSSDYVVFDTVSANLVINLNSGTGHEVTDGTNTVNWASNVIPYAYGGTSHDVIIGNSDFNFLQGNGGNDTLDGGTNNDTMDGGSGNDIYLFNAGFGNDSISGDSAGLDALDLRAVTNALTINLASSGGSEISDGSNSVNWSGDVIEYVYSGSGADLIYGSAAGNILEGNGGNDTMDGAGGSDIYSWKNGFGNDTVIDSAGTEMASLWYMTVNVTVNLTSGAGHEITDGTNTVNWAGSIIENARTGSGNDSLIGNTNGNSLDGGEGQDTLDGGLGGDTYAFRHNWGLDTIIDAGGSDMVDLRALSYGITINLTSGTGNEIQSYNSHVNWAGDGIEHALGGSGHDLIFGNGAGNILNGGGGNDTLDGQGGNDTYTYSNSWGADSIIDSAGIESVDMRSVTNALTINLVSGIGHEVTDGTNTINWADSAIEKALGGTSNDVIYGNANDNLLNGHYGNDTLIGGSGDDIYVYDNHASSGQDVINDASGLLDKLGLSGFTLASATWTAVDGADADSFFDSLLITFSGGRSISILNYFDNTTTNLHFLNAGAGHIEQIVFSDDSDVDLAQMKTLLGANTITGTAAAESLTGGSTSDWIDGLGGNDTLSGAGGDDILVGGTGNDSLAGGADNDTYRDFIGTFGTDIINDASGSADILDLSNYALSDVTSWQAVDGPDPASRIDRLVINFAGGNSITIFNYFDDASTDEDLCGAGTGHIETIIFSDDSSVDLAQIKSIIP